MKKVYFSLFSAIILGLIITLPAFAQEPLQPRPSPLAVTTMKYEDDYVKVTYSRPHKNNRDIFGGLVPYGQVWRFGANEATEITTTGKILLNGNTLEPGTYSLFCIPNQNSWTIMVNEELGQWGAYNYNKDSDVFRFDVKTESINNVVYEPFTIAFEQKNDQATMVVMWDRTKISIPVEFVSGEH